MLLHELMVIIDRKGRRDWIVSEQPRVFPDFLIGKRVLAPGLVVELVDERRCVRLVIDRKIEPVTVTFLTRRLQERIRHRLLYKSRTDEFALVLPLRLLLSLLLCLVLLETDSSLVKELAEQLFEMSLFGSLL